MFGFFITIFIYCMSIGNGFIYLIYLYFIIAALDIILFLITGIKIFMLSRHLTNSDQARFNLERKWYWTTIKLSLIMLVTWPTQVYVWKSNFKFLNFILSDCIILLTSMTISVILIGKKKVRTLFLEKYRGNRSWEV